MSTLFIQHQYFDSIVSAKDEGYIECKACANITNLLRREKKELDAVCYMNGLHYSFNPVDGALDILSSSGSWKIIILGKRKKMTLFHKNTRISSVRKEKDELIEGYHRQNSWYSSLVDYARYISEHDEFRQLNPVYRPVNTYGLSKKKKHKEKIRHKKAKRTQGVRYVMALFDILEKQQAV